MWAVKSMAGPMIHSVEYRAVLKCPAYINMSALGSKIL